MQKVSKEDLKERYNSGQSIREIAKDLNRNSHTIRRNLYEYGIKEKKVVMHPSNSDIEKLAVRGMKSKDIADEFGVSQGKVSSVIRKSKVLEYRPFQSKGCDTIRKIIGDMKPIDAVEYLLEYIENEKHAESQYFVGLVIGFGFTEQEAKILITLINHGFGGASRETLFLSFVSTKNPDKLPCGKILDVYICKLRKKINKYGFKARIDNIFGFGYRIEVKKGFEFPWDEQCQALTLN